MEVLARMPDEEYNVIQQRYGMEST